VLIAVGAHKAAISRFRALISMACIAASNFC